MVRFRPARSDETRVAYDIFVPTLAALKHHLTEAQQAAPSLPDTSWPVRQPLFDHLAATADEWWFAEDEATGAALGYARSIVRGDVRELTEFFVLPEAQGGGIGRELLARAFPAEGVAHRSIVATTDARAIARYLGTGLPARLAMGFVEGTPSRIAIPSDLAREAIDPDAPPLDELGAIDQALIGFRRDVDHRWLASQRPGWLYRRGGRAVGYGYHPIRPSWGGPFAALDAVDLLVILADAETAAADAGHATVSFDMAFTANEAFRHLLGRGFKVDPFMMLYFTDGPIDGFDRYVLTSPPFFV
jgi:GNAT superfamily N-acetyltransferase